MYSTHTGPSEGVVVSCWQRAQGNLILHFVNYKLFIPVISVWVCANDTLTIGALSASNFKATTSKGIVTDVRESLRENNKALERK